MSASAALLDFTDDTVGATSPGSVGGVGYTLTGVPEDPNANFNDGPCAICAPLKMDNDGLGIKDDEISSNANFAQYVTITFNEVVRLTGIYWLDLYRNPNNPLDNEVGFVSVGAVPGAPADHATNAVFDFDNGRGFAYDGTISLTGMSFTFFVGDGNDAAGRADAALAGLEISAIPLPAGFLLLGTALGGLGLARRRKKA